MTMPVLINMMPVMLTKVITAGLLFACLTGPARAQDILDKASRWKEEKMLARLSTIQGNPENTIQEFKSDGCSGGMSYAWSWMAETFPGFELNYQKEPPWQHCCVDHDRLYWQGETTNGFDLRKQADKSLEKCVIASGKVKGQELASDSDTKRFMIEKGFEKVALQMYIAVRLGGGPCTLFPWRWGYGWPGCWYQPGDDYTDNNDFEE
jgi:hypothetical protein